MYAQIGFIFAQIAHNILLRNTQQGFNLNFIHWLYRLFIKV